MNRSQRRAKRQTPVHGAKISPRAHTLGELLAERAALVALYQEERAWMTRFEELRLALRAIHMRCEAEGRELTKDEQERSESLWSQIQAMRPEKNAK